MGKENFEKNLVLGLVVRVTAERISGLLEELKADPEITVVYQRVSTPDKWLYIVTEQEKKSKSSQLEKGGT